MNRVTKQRLKAASQYCFKNGIVGKELKTYLCAACGVSDIAVEQFLMAGNSRPSPSNQHKRARAAAFQEAKRRNLWGKGEAEVYAKWYRRLLKRFFPKYAKRLADIIGKWYRSNIKRWSKMARASVHDKEAQEFARVTRKLHRQHARETAAR